MGSESIDVKNVNMRRAVAILTFGRIQGLILMFLGRGVAARILGSEAMGAFASSTAAVFFLSRLLSFGLGPSAQYNSAHGRYPRSAVLSALLIWISFITLLITPLLWCMKDLIRVLLFGDNSFAFSIFIIFLPAMFALFLSLGFCMFLLGMECNVEYNRVTVWPSVLFLCGCGITWVGDWGYWGIIYAQLCFWVSGAILALFYSLRKSNGLTWPGHDLIAQILNYGARSALLASFAYGLNRAALLTGNHLVSGKELGQYAVAASVGDGITLLYGMTGSVLLVRVSRAITVEERLRVTCLTSRITLLLLTTVSLGLAVLSPWLIPWIFGNDFSASSSMLVLLLPGLLALAQKRLLESYLYGCNKQQLALLSYLATAVVLLLALPPLSKAFGGKGLAAATSLGNLAALLANFWVIRRKDDISVLDLWKIRRADLSYLLKILRSFRRLLREY